MLDARAFRGGDGDEREKEVPKEREYAMIKPSTEEMEIRERGTNRDRMRVDETFHGGDGDEREVTIEEEWREENREDGVKNSDPRPPIYIILGAGFPLVDDALL